ncbi:putative plant disease resistance response protein [Rosa chinensis]|uniref:Putative plant disease resistance response protein n=1 Tax=Rosa chinensis TaxID=74649 RepID=A0A2P6QAD8_ROSCH|nr:putative plant disease resistance response protein [Rosa chinensis]
MHSRSLTMSSLIEGHQLGSGLLGTAQGFYVASSKDGSSQTIAFTAMFESGGFCRSSGTGVEKRRGQSVCVCFGKDCGDRGCDSNWESEVLVVVVEAAEEYGSSEGRQGSDREVAVVSHLAVMGGTRKYLNAKGYAVVKTINGVNGQNTDGIDTVLQFTVYLSY